MLTKSLMLQHVDTMVLSVREVGVQRLRIASARIESLAFRLSRIGPQEETFWMPAILPFIMSTRETVLIYSPHISVEAQVLCCL